MSEYWSPIVGQLEPYIPGEQPRTSSLIKLNTNENPLPPSPRVLEAIRAVPPEQLRLYPDPGSVLLRQAIAAREGLLPDNVFVGNGSDEVLGHCFAALLKHDKPLALPDISYGFYPSWARLFGIETRQIPLDAGLRIELAAYGQEPAGAIIIANPNAPTGIAVTRTELAGFIGRHRGIPVVVDEAYVEFGAETAAPLIPAHPNLLVVRSLSKSYGLAGLRVGYALGQPPLIEALARVKDSFNSYPLGCLAQAGAAAAIEDQAYFETVRAQVIETRASFTASLAARGFNVLPSAANFVFAAHPAWSGAELFAALRRRNILVRHFSRPRIADYLRITIGLPQEMDMLLAAIDGIFRDERK